MRVITASFGVLVLATTLAGADTPSETTSDAEVDIAIAACDGGDASQCLRASTEMRRRAGGKADDTTRYLRRRGIALLERSCADKSADACFDHGKILLESRRDVARGVGEIDRACELGKADACMFLGEQYSSGPVVRKDAKRALVMYDRACAKGIGRACDELADGLGEGEGGKVPTYQRHIVALHRQACNAEDREGCAHSGDQRLAEGDRAGAYVDFQNACELGDVNSCLRAGMIGDKPERARILFLRACDAGMAIGCSNLAELFATGRGGKRNWRQAITLAEKACSLDGIEPCTSALALKKQRPDGACKTEPDCERMCDEGLGSSCRHLAELRDNSADAYERGCAERDGESCTRRGHAASTLELGAKWYIRGCLAGDRAACTFRDFGNAKEGSRKAIDSLRGLCARDRNACVLLGLAIEEEKATDAQQLWRKACDRKHGIACRLLADALGGDKGKPLMKRACQVGDGVACKELSLFPPPRPPSVPAWL